MFVIIHKLNFFLTNVNLNKKPRFKPNKLLFLFFVNRVFTNLGTNKEDVKSRYFISSVLQSARKNRTEFRYTGGHWKRNYFYFYYIHGTQYGVEDGKEAPMTPSFYWGLEIAQTTAVCVCGWFSCILQINGARNRANNRKLVSFRLARRQSKKKNTYFVNPGLKKRAWSKGAYDFGARAFYGLIIPCFDYHNTMEKGPFDIIRTGALDGP